MFKILIVEDEDLIRKGLVYTFDWLSYDCVVVGEAFNGQVAIPLINEQNPDIVITDIKMPIMDGLEMLAQLKHRSFETIIITGHAEFSYAKKAIALDVSEFLLKPIDHSELGHVIEKIISKIEQKKMMATIQNKVKDYRDIKVMNLEYYYNKSHYTSRYTPKVLEYVSANYNHKMSIDDIADDLEVSSAYLSKKFKEDTKHTFNDFLNKYRIQKALEYMYDSNLKIYEIAEMVGYSEYKYFSQVFKNYMNYSPTEFLHSKLFVKKASE